MKDFFTHINHNLLIQNLSSANIDNKTILLIRKFLKMKVKRDYSIMTLSEGIIQGSSLSPLLSNLYLNDFDHFLDKQNIRYVRFSDDIKIFAETYENALDLYNLAADYLTSKCLLLISENKSGIFKSENRGYFGYEFYKTKNIICIRKKARDITKRFNVWNSSSISFHDNNYHLINNGILTRKDFSILFENTDKKMYIPIETTDSIAVHSNITISSDFFNPNGQEFPRLCRRWDELPVSHKADFFLTYGSVYAIFEIKR